MKWSDIRMQHPGKFILLGNIKEEQLSDSMYRILEGTVLRTSDNAKEIRTAYKDCKNKGMQVLFSLPGTPQDFIVEDVLFMGMLK